MYVLTPDEVKSLLKSGTKPACGELSAAGRAAVNAQRIAQGWPSLDDEEQLLDDPSDDEEELPDDEKMSRRLAAAKSS